MFVSSGIRALDLRAMATDGASGAQGAKIAEISPTVHGVQTFRAETTAQISTLRDSLERDREDMAALRIEMTARFDALMARLEPAENPSLRFGCFGSLPPPSDSPVARVRGTTPSSTDGSPLSMFMGNSASSRSKAPQSGPLPTPASYCAPPPHRFPSNQNQWVPLPQAVHVISSPSSPPPQRNPYPLPPQPNHTEFCQLSLGPTALPLTASNPSSSPLLSVVPAHREVSHSGPASALVDEHEKLSQPSSVAATDKLSFTSPKYKRDDVDVPIGTTPCVAIAGAPPLDSERSSLHTDPTTFEVISHTNTDNEMDVVLLGVGVNADSAQLLMYGLVASYKLYISTSHQSLPHIREVYSRSFRSVGTLISGAMAPLGRPLAAFVPIVGCLSPVSLTSAVIVDITETELATHGFSIVNLDWRCDKTVELYVMLQSLWQKDEELKSVVYSSNFGIELIEAEDIHCSAGLFDDQDGMQEEDPIVICGSASEISPEERNKVNIAATARALIPGSHPSWACILYEHHSVVVEAAIIMRKLCVAVLYTPVCSTDILKSISKFYPLRYSSDSLERVVVFMTPMHKPFQYVVKEEFVMTMSTSTFNSPTHALRKLVSLLLVDVHSSPPILDNMLREAEKLILGTLMVRYITELLPLKSLQQGLDIVIHYRLLAFVSSSHLLHCSEGENLGIIPIMQHLHDWQSTSYPPESVHLSALIHTWQVTTRDGIDFGAALTTLLASGEFLVTSGKTHIQVHALTTLLLEFERYMNFEIITFELLADDYCYWKRSLPLSARFENIQWSAAQMLGADELPKLLPTYMTTSICVVAADTLLVYEILTGVLGSYNRVLAVHMGLFQLLHTSSIAIVPFMVIIVLVSTWPNQDHSLIPLIGAAYVKRKGALSRLQAVVHPRNLSLIHHIPHLNVTTECVPGLVLVICGVYYDTHFASKMEILIANHDLNFEDAKSSNKLAMALAVVEIQTKGTKALHQLHPHNDILPILLQVYSFPHDLRSQKHEHELDFLSILYMDHAPSLLVPTMFISHVTGTTSVSIISKMVLHGTTLLVQISDTTFTSDNLNSANEVSYDNQQLGNNLSEFYACEHHTVSSYQGFLVPLVVRYSHKEKKIHHTVSSTPILLMYAGDVNSVVQLNFQAWLFLLNLHERGPAKNRVFPNSPSFMRVTRLFALKLILLLLLAMVFRVPSVVLKRVIPATKLVDLKYKKVAVHAISHFAIFCVASVFMYLQLAEEFFPSQILESLGLYMAKKEIPTTWIWLATTRLCLQVWELNLHGMNLITAQMLIGDALFMRELMIADACDIIPTGDIGVRLVGHCGADVSLTNSYSLMHHSPLFWLLIKVMSPQSHTTYTWANYPVASYEFLFVLRNITSELSMVYSSSWGFPQPTIADYMKQVFARTISTCGCCTDRDEIKFMLLVPRVGHKADCLGILPLLYKLVFAMASLGTLVLHVTIVSVILGDYASRYTTVVIYMVTTPCFAELVMGVSTTLVLGVQNATRHTLSVPTQKTAQVLLFRASGDGNLLMHIGQEMQMVYAEVSRAEFLILKTPKA